MDELNIGVIGLGAIGQKHCAALAVLERANLCAVADVDEKTLASTAAQYKAAPYANAEGLLKHPGLDAVVIATPDHLHREACILAAQHGKHILVEKPLATTIDDSQAIIAAAEAAGVKLMVGFTLRFGRVHLALLSSLSAGQKSRGGRHARQRGQHLRPAPERHLPVGPVEGSLRCADVPWTARF